MVKCLQSIFSRNNEGHDTVQNEALYKQFDTLVFEDVKRSSIIYLIGFCTFISVYGLEHYQFLVIFCLLMLLAICPLVALKSKNITLRDLSYRAFLLIFVTYTSYYTGGIFSPFLMLVFFSTMTVVPYSVLLLTETGKIFGLISTAVIVGFFLLGEYYGFVAPPLINIMEQPAVFAIVLISCVSRISMADKYHKKAIYSYHQNFKAQLEKHQKLVQNANLNLLVFNAETYKIENYSPSARIFTAYYDYNIDSFKDHILERIQVSRHEKEPNIHQIPLEMNGETRYFEIITEYYRQDQEVSTSFKNYEDTIIKDEVFCLIYDVTNRVNYEQSIIEARDNALQLYKSKSSLLAQMSHELRTPLNAIIGFSEVMELELLGKMLPSYKEYSKNINQSGQYLLTIVNDILDMAWIESGKYDPYIEKVNLDEMLDHIMAVTCHLAEKKDIKITLEKEFLSQEGLYSDMHALKQILINIVSNAVKYCPSGSQVYIHLTVKKEQALFHIKDNGYGFTENVLKHFGSPFNIDKSHLTDGQKSTGLGLSITKGLAEALGGQVHAYNAEGAVIDITIPNQPDKKGNTSHKKVA